MAQDMFRIVAPYWLSAVAEQTKEITRLVVYRSVELRDSDSIYAPVKALIGTAKPTSSIRLDDPMMMFGEADLEVYELNSQAA